MIGAIAAFEWKLQVRQPAFFAAAAFLALMGFALPAGNFGAANLHVNAPWLVMESQAFLSMLTLFVAAIFASSAVLRDGESRMAEIVWSAPLRRGDYLLGRYAGAFAATLTCALAAVAGMLAGLLAPSVEPDRLADLSLAGYVWAFVVVMLPNVLLATALLFAVAAVTRSAIATHAAAVAAYLLYLVAAALTGSPLMAGSAPGRPGLGLAEFLDPFGLSPFFSGTRYWSIAEKNARLVPLTGTFLVNRLLWIGAALMVLALAWRFFSFRSRKERLRSAAPGVEARAVATPLSTVPRAAVSMSAARTAFAVWKSTARLELRALVRSVPFLLLLLAWAGLALSEIDSAVRHGEYGSATLPATSIVLAALAQPVSLAGTILLLYYGTELFWRDRRYRFDPLSDASPASGAAIFAARFTVLAVLAATVIAMGIACGVAVQLQRGWTHFDPALWGWFLYYAGLPLLLLAAGSAFIHAALSPGRYAGLVLVLGFSLFTLFGAGLVELRLWRFGDLPAVPFSEMSGRGPQAVLFHWLAMHWGAIAGLMLIAAGLLKRDMDRPVRERLRRLAVNAGPAARVSAAVLAAVAVATGAWIFRNTQAAGEVSGNERLERRAAYERIYRPLASLPAPSIEAVDVRLDLRPGDHAADVEGQATLVNRTASPMIRVWVGVDRGARNVSIEAANAAPAFRDALHGMMRFDLASPLQPGGRIPLHFALTLGRPGFSDDGDASLASNGVLLMSHDFLPFAGYQPAYEINDPRERRRRGLPQREPAAAGEDVPSAAQANRVHLAVTISTPAGQTAIAPGTLVKRWESNGRRWFRYVTAVPVATHFAIASANYARTETKSGSVAIELLHHPPHVQNVKRVLEAATVAFDYCRTNFGPYPHGELRIVEVPSLEGWSGQAFPGTVALTENRLFLVDSRDPSRPDLVARRVAHEVAHQWWGYALSPPPLPGAAAITESLTKYTELMVVERMHGKDAVREFLTMELDRYLAGRSHESREEVPLFLVRDRPYVYYAKGAIVMMAVRRLVGEEALDSALSSLLASGNGTAPALLAELRRVASPRDFALIDQWFREIVLYDLGVDSAAARRLPDGRYEVRIRLHAAKAVAAPDGKETARPMSERIELAVRAGDGTVVYSGLHEVRSGASGFTVIATGRPASLTIDPEVTRIDRNRFDNTTGVTF